MMDGGLQADFLILADSAQVQGEKLFMLGGGWSQIMAKQFPAQHHMAVAAGILIPWLETNMQHEFRVEVRDEDGKKFGEISGKFEQGRPPGLPPGTTQRVMLAINFTIRIEKPSEAVAELSLDGNVVKTVPFRIINATAR
jgi:hypothetical protein